ncbi:MAG: acylphosphatase [Phycisphaerae bacterium]|nr:acylphosphatase [Phycisphaerae bacterium]
MRRIEARFIGRVQGVGFRATVRDIARAWNIAGWVRNEPDGSVLLVTEGTESETDRFITEIERQLAGYIRSVHRTEGVAVGERGFGIRR